jgi:hypothetical protein
MPREMLAHVTQYRSKQRSLAWIPHMPHPATVFLETLQLGVVVGDCRPHEQPRMPTVANSTMVRRVTLAAHVTTVTHSYHRAHSSFGLDLPTGAVSRTSHHLPAEGGPCSRHPSSRQHAPSFSFRSSRPSRPSETEDDERPRRKKVQCERRTPTALTLRHRVTVGR